MFYFALRTFRFLITFSINIKQQFQKMKINSFIPIPYPYPSLFFPCSSLPHSYFEMVRLCSLSLIVFPMLLRSLFHNLSLFP
jgi:hypothetical protein